MKQYYQKYRNSFFFLVLSFLIVMVGIFQSWSLALSIINVGLISAIMSLGVNIQWGYAGLFNVGIMGFAALGGVAGVLISKSPVSAAWNTGGLNILTGLLLIIIGIFSIRFFWNKIKKYKKYRYYIISSIILIFYIILRIVLDPAIERIEAIDPSSTGYLGGLGLPILISWPVGGIFAAIAAYAIGKVALGLRSDYLAIATLGISEIIIYFLKNEEWLTRGVKDVSGLPRPVPYEIDLQQTIWMQEISNFFGVNIVDGSYIFVKISYMILFLIILVCIFSLSEIALKSPWGRMMRAIRDNETAAEAMGKNVTKKHLVVFVIGSGVIGMAGAMLTTLDGSFTPNTYQPLRFTFLIWVMVIIGGSGNNWGAILGGMFIWFFWIEAEPIGLWLIDKFTFVMAEDYWLKIQLIENAAHMRLMTVGIILILALRFSPKGLIPETNRY
tara:strand:- start:1079 stop:2404 length:1326 start_codon:yes stop_codon:yes gene_type:complete